MNKLSIFNNWINVEMIFLTRICNTLIFHFDLHKRVLALVLIALICCLSLPVNAQRWGYIVKGSSYYRGYLNYAADALYGRPIKFSTTKNAAQATYSADSISEYGFEDRPEYGTIGGRVYYSKNIDGKQVFLRQLANGQIRLYSTKINGKLELFLEYSDVFKPLNKESYHDELKNVLKRSPKAVEFSELVFYNQRSLPRIIQYYNLGSFSYFPRTRFGVILGSTNRSLTMEYRGFDPKFKSRTGITFGGFIDIPNGEFSKISTRIEILYKSHKYALTVSNSDVIRDYDIELSTINIPALIRFREYYKSVQPFIDFGFVFGFNVKNKTHLTETLLFQGNEVLELELDKIAPTEFGMAIGLGLEYQVNYKRTAGLEFRYQFTFGSPDTIEHTISDLQLLASFSF